MGRMYLAKYMTPDSLDDIRGLCRNSNEPVNHVYLHWTAGWYGQAYDDYHICIDKDGEIYIMCDSINDYLQHTYRRNSYSVGVSLMCCAEAVANNGYDADFGPEPVTASQIESMAQVVAVLSSEFNLNLSNPDDIMTHYEAACLDGYGVPYGTYVNGVYQGDSDSRWDLWYIPDFYGQDGKMVPGGDLIRGKAAFYIREWGTGGD